MIIFLNSEGAIIGTSAEPVGRNSNDAAQIYIVAPLSSAAQIYFTFTLPNGQPLFGGLTELTDERVQAPAQTATHLFFVSGVSVWKYKIPGSVTRYSGTVQYDVVTVTESMRATAHGSFAVSRGNKLAFPDPNPEAWDKIVSDLSGIIADIEEIQRLLWGEDEDDPEASSRSIIERLSESEKNIQKMGEEKAGFTDYATSEKAGVVKVGQGSSTNIGITDGLIKVLKATEEHIAARGENYADYVLTASKTNAIVKAALTDEKKMLLSDGEKATARETIGAASTEDVNGMRVAFTMKDGFNLFLSLLNAENEVISTHSIDLPLEKMIVSGTVSDDGNNIILTLDNGETIEFGVANLVNGLVKQEDFDELKENFENQEVLKIEIAPSLDGNDTDKAPSVQAVNEGLAPIHQAMPSSMQKMETYAYDVAVEQGRVSDIDGEEIEDNVTVRTDFIPIGKGVSGANESGTQHYLAVAYDSKKDFLGAATIDSNGKWVGDYSYTAAPCNVDEIVSVFSEAKFVRFNFVDYNELYFTPEDLRFSFTAQKVVGLNGRTMDEVLEEELAGKLDKTTESYKVYGTIEGGMPKLFPLGRSTAGAIPTYASDNVNLSTSKVSLATARPIYPWHCTPKIYVDEAIEAVREDIGGGSTELVSVSGSDYNGDLRYLVPEGALPNFFIATREFTYPFTNPIGEQGFSTAKFTRLDFYDSDNFLIDSVTLTDGQDVYAMPEGTMTIGTNVYAVIDELRQSGECYFDGRYDLIALSTIALQVEV